MFQPNFTITHNLMLYMSRIEAARAIINHAPLVPSWEAQFRTDALKRTVHFGTKIEGNDLTLEQAEKVIQAAGKNPGQVSDETGIIARDRDIQEVINYRNVIKWIDDRAEVDEEFVFSQETLFTLHKLAVDHLIDAEFVAKYRNQQVIVKSATDGSIAFRPPVSIEIPFLIKDFFEWATSEQAKTLHPIFRAAITHYQLVFIHPFVEGNGRTARALATLLLYSQGYDFKRFFSIEQYFDSDVDAYYQALLSVQQSPKADMTYWLEYFCYGLALELDKIQGQVERLSKDVKMKKQLGKQVALSERQILLLELFNHQDKVTSDDMQELLPNVSVDTILRDVKDLIEKGVIEKHGVTKGVHYTLSD